MMKFVLIVLVLFAIFVVVFVLRKKKKSYSPEAFSGDLQLKLTKTRNQIFDRILSVVRGGSIAKVDLEKIEEILITADIGVETTKKLMRDFNEAVSLDTLKCNLKENIEKILNQEFVEENIDKKPYVILVAGVNGVGKTTTIAKLAKMYLDSNKKVMLAAGDTFRAAAVDQLKKWGEKLQVPVVSQNQGADSAAVIYSAIESAKTQNIDIVIADTAGRLHTKINLMEELKKIDRVIKKIIPSAPHETLLVLDATTGQNAIQQVRLFGESIPITGLIVTKLDGTAKGGVIIGIVDQFQIPVRYIGVGERMEDLRTFDPVEFADAILG